MSAGLAAPLDRGADGDRAELGRGDGRAIRPELADRRPRGGDEIDAAVAACSGRVIHGASRSLVRCTSRRRSRSPDR